MKKRITALILAMVMAAAFLGGCSQTRVDASQYGKTVIATYGGESIYLDELNYYLRTNQYQSEVEDQLVYMGVEKWDEEIDFYGLFVMKMSDTLIEMSVIMLHQVYVLSELAKQQGITLSAEDEAKVAEAVTAFFADSDEALLSYVNLTPERLTEIYRRNALANLMYAAATADVDTNVSDEEAHQYDVSYVYISESAATAIDENLTPEELADLLIEAVNGGAELSDAVEEYEGLAKTSVTMGDGDNVNTYGTLASELGVGEIGKIAYGTNNAYYVVMRDSDFNEEASQAKRAALEAQIIADYFAEQYAEWEAAVEFKTQYKLIQNLPVSEPIYQGK